MNSRIPFRLFAPEQLHATLTESRAASSPHPQYVAPLYNFLTRASGLPKHRPISIVFGDAASFKAAFAVLLVTAAKVCVPMLVCRPLFYRCSLCLAVFS